MKRLLRAVLSTFTLVLLLLPGVARAQQQYVILHQFGDGTVQNDGGSPEGGLVEDTILGLFGVTVGGGSAGDGTVYKVTAAGQETILHSFGDGSVANDGSEPTNITLGSDGNFYGVTYGGGSAGKGAVFKMTPAGQVTILHSFGDGSVPNDGIQPEGPLAEYTDGSYYGTTNLGGANGEGTVFKITTSGQVTILYSFAIGVQTNVSVTPYGVTLGSDGNFYGTTFAGGDGFNDGQRAGGGTVYKITPAGAFTVLHNFADGSVPNDGFEPNLISLVEGSDGDFYGATFAGGTFAGTAFKITLSGQETILHQFDSFLGLDGDSPLSGMIVGSDGNFYGTTWYGGSTYVSPSNNGYGSIYEMTPAGQVTVLHSFNDGSVPNDGHNPLSPLVQNSNGYFYGVATYGGSAGGGLLYRLTPPPGMTITPKAVFNGNTAQCTVDQFISQKSNVTVSLQSSNPSVASVPSTAVILAGSASVSVTVTTYAVGKVAVPVTITATLPSGTASAVVTVMPHLVTIP